MFSQEQVKSQVLASRITVDHKVQGILAGYQEDSNGNWMLPNNQKERVHGFADGPVRRYRTPLILAGAMLLGLVLVQVVRRRGGS